MRFLLFDRITHLEPGRRVEGVKQVSLADEAFRGHFDRRSLFPATLVIESMLQLTAWSAIAAHDFRFSVVLSVMEDARVPSALEPGTTLHLVGELLGTNPKGSIARARAEVAGETVAEIGRVLYAHVPVEDPDALRERCRAFGGEG